MVTYKCDTCNKLFNHKGNFEAHKNRKKTCNFVVLDKNDFKQHKTTVIDNKCYTCSYCNRTFKHSQSVYKHIRENCMSVRKDKEEKEEIFNKLIRELDENKKHIKQLEKTNRKIKECIDNKTNSIVCDTYNDNKTINNTYNDNRTYNIVSFGKEDTSFITEKEWKTIICKRYKSIEDLVIKTHFNENKPENHNIYISNIKSKYIMVHDGGTWCLKNKKDTIDDLYDEKAYIIISKVDELKEKSKLPFRIVNKYNEIRTGYDEDKIREALVKDIELVLYNKRNIPIYTRKHVDSN